MGQLLQKGFTLLEMLVAVSIFSLVVGGSYDLLSRIIAAKEATDNRSRELASLQLFFDLVRQDVSQIKERIYMEEFASDKRVAVLRTGTSELQMTRGAVKTPFFEQDSSLLWVKYALESEGDTFLLSRFTASFDEHLAIESVGREAISEMRPRQQVFTRKVTELRFRYLNEHEEWVNEWDSRKKPKSAEPLMDHLEDAIHPLPVAIEVSLQHEVLGEIRKLYALPSGQEIPVEKIE